LKAASTDDGSFVDQIMWILNKLIGLSAISERGDGLFYDGWAQINGHPKAGLRPEKGERYNRRLYNTPAVIDSRLQFIEFCSIAFTGFNKTRSAAVAALQDPFGLRLLCAAAIGAAEVLYPLQLAIKQAESALAADPLYRRTADRLEQWSKDATELITGNGRLLFPETVQTYSKGASAADWKRRHSALSACATADPRMVPLLQEICTAMHKELLTLLPPDPSTLTAQGRLALAIASATNDRVESTFGMIGNSIKHSPGAPTHYHQTKALLKVNDEARLPVDYRGVRRLQRQLELTMLTKREQDAAVAHHKLQLVALATKKREIHKVRVAKKAAQLANVRLVNTAAEVLKLTHTAVILQVQAWNARQKGTPSTAAVASTPHGQKQAIKVGPLKTYEHGPRRQRLIDFLHQKAV
jgi:hypothetical protein